MRRSARTSGEMSVKRTPSFFNSRRHMASDRAIGRYPSGVSSTRAPRGGRRDRRERTVAAERGPARHGVRPLRQAARRGLGGGSTSGVGQAFPGVEAAVGNFRLGQRPAVVDHARRGQRLQRGLPRGRGRAASCTG